MVTSHHIYSSFVFRYANSSHVLGKTIVKRGGKTTMPKTRRGPNDRSNNEERLKKTIQHMEAAEEVMEYAPKKDLVGIKKNNEQRAKSIKELEKEIQAEEKSGIKGYL